MENEKSIFYDLGQYFGELIQKTVVFFVSFFTEGGGADIANGVSDNINSQNWTSPQWVAALLITFGAISVLISLFKGNIFAIFSSGIVFAIGIYGFNYFS